MKYTFYILLSGQYNTYGKKKQEGCEKSDRTGKSGKET